MLRSLPSVPVPVSPALVMFKGSTYSSISVRTEHSWYKSLNNITENTVHFCLPPPCWASWEGFCCCCFSDLNLYRSQSHCYNHCEFIYSTVLLCLVNTIPWSYPSPLGLTIFLFLLPWRLLSLVREVCDVHIPFRNKHSAGCGPC